MAEGIKLYETDHLDDALSKLLEAQSIFPQDPPLRLLVTSLEQALEQKPRVKRTVLLDFR
jgi:hypothetical protein